MYVIAEIGSNWNGDISLAKETIAACKNAGANAVKFQMWDADLMYNGKYKQYQLTEKIAKDLAEFSRELGITWFATPSYPEAVDILEDIHVPMYKVASITSALKHPKALETLYAISKVGKPVFVSDGYGVTSDWKDILTDVKVMEMGCIPEYPAPFEKYVQFEGHPFVSDHTLGTSLMYYYATRFEDAVIEKHVKLKDNSSPDSPFSIYTDELADFITLSKSSVFKHG